MAGLTDIVGQGTAKLDALWGGMWSNQETIAFKALNGLYTTMKGTLSKITTELAEKAVTFIAKNLAIAASWIAQAIAAAAAWLWATSPWLAIGVGGGMIAGILAGWSGIKKTLGFAKGGVFTGPTFAPVAGGNMGVIGEAGPEVAAPLSAFPALFQSAFGIAPGGQDFQMIATELRAVGRALAERQVMVVDSYGMAVGQMQAMNDNDYRS
jgi:hypothetical protein